MGCADPPSKASKGVGAPHQCSRVHQKRSGWGVVVTGRRKHPKTSVSNEGPRRTRVPPIPRRAQFAKSGRQNVVVPPGSSFPNVVAAGCGDAAAAAPPAALAAAPSDSSACSCCMACPNMAIETTSLCAMASGSILLIRTTN